MINSMDNINTQSTVHSNIDYEEYKISHPVKYTKNDNILIFPNSVFAQISTADCNDTINGNCINDISFDECVSKCTDNPDKCAVGYYIKTPTSNICVPIDINTFKNSNPVYKLRVKDIYDEFKKSEVTTFIDTRTYPFPPNEANNVFYLDVTQLVSQKTELSMGKEGEEPPLALFEDKSNGVNIQLLPFEFSNTLSARYIPIKYNDNIFLRVPYTNYILSKIEFEKSFEWQITQISGSSSFDAFKVIHVDNSDNNEILTYGNTFKLKYGDIYCCAIENNTLIASSLNFEQLESRGYETVFVFKPKMIGYYCEDGQCKSIELSKTVQDMSKATYNGKEIFVTPGCYNICELEKNISNIKTYDNNWIWITISIIIIIIIIIVIFMYFKCKHV